MESCISFNRRLERLRRNSAALLDFDADTCGWSHKSVVYFIRPVGMEGPIKIGCTGDLAKRLGDLCKNSPFPLEVIVTTPGAVKLERKFHARHQASRLHGEWFAASPQLLSDICRLEAGDSTEGVLADNFAVAA